jgi:DNA repair exonuclease SbcCD nuclease subunit
MSIIEEAYSNVKVVHEYEEISIGNSSFGLMSWINNENLDRNLKRIKSANTKYLCLHGEIKGFEMTKGVIAESGLDQDLFSGYDEVFSGHFHIKNKIGNIYYIGNPFQTNWDDLGSDRGFHIYDSETDTMNFIKNDYENYDLLYDEDIFNAELYKYQDKIVKVLVPSLSDLDQVKLNSFLDLLQEITYEYTIIETNVKEVDNPEQVKVKSNREMISDYVHQLNIDEDEKTKVLSIMNNLYSTVLINKEYE